MFLIKYITLYIAICVYNYIINIESKLYEYYLVVGYDTSAKGQSFKVLAVFVKSDKSVIFLFQLNWITFLYQFYVQILKI